MQTFPDRSAHTTLVPGMGVEGRENAFTMLEAEVAQETGRKEDLRDAGASTQLTQGKQCRAAGEVHCAEDRTSMTE